MRRFGTVLAAVLLTLAACGGCASDLTAEQRMWLERGRNAFEAGRFTQAAQTLSRFIEQVEPSQQEFKQALYVRGMSYAQSGRRSAAYADLKRCVATADDPQTVWRAYVVLGTLHFEDRDWQQAAVCFRAAADRMPARSPKDDVLYRLGLCYERLGRWPDSRWPLEELVRQFPKSALLRRAKQKLERRASYFAVQAGSFAVEANADRQAQYLQGRNLPAYVRREHYNRAPRWVVLVGHYPTIEEAWTQLGVVRQYVRDALVWP
jgi:tetratricopeptide (TPR) repeat protein